MIIIRTCAYFFRETVANSLTRSSRTTHSGNGHGICASSLAPNRRRKKSHVSYLYSTCFGVEPNLR